MPRDLEQGRRRRTDLRQVELGDARLDPHHARVDDVEDRLRHLEELSLDALRAGEHAADRREQRQQRRIFLGTRRKERIGCVVVEPLQLGDRVSQLGEHGVVTGPLGERDPDRGLRLVELLVGGEPLVLQGPGPLDGATRELDARIDRAPPRLDLRELDVELDPLERQLSTPRVDLGAVGGQRRGLGDRQRRADETEKLSRGDRVAELRQSPLRRDDRPGHRWRHQGGVAVARDHAPGDLHPLDQLFDSDPVQEHADAPLLLEQERHLVAGRVVFRRRFARGLLVRVDDHLPEVERRPVVASKDDRQRVAPDLVDGDLGDEQPGSAGRVGHRADLASGSSGHHLDRAVLDRRAVDQPGEVGEELDRLPDDADRMLDEELDLVGESGVSDRRVLRLDLRVRRSVTVWMRMGMRVRVRVVVGVGMRVVVSLGARTDQQGDQEDRSTTEGRDHERRSTGEV